MSELFPECRAFLEHELKKMEGCALTTAEHGRQNWMYRCLQEIKAMSTGQNRRSINELTNDEMQAALKTWHPPVLPLPETGAVDVEADKVVAVLIGVLRVLYSRAQGFTWDEAKPVIATFIQPLTQRISELEQENERLKNRYIEDVRLATLRAEAAEAHAKELEKENERLKKNYFDVADAVTRESSGVEDLCSQARAIRGRVKELEQKLEAALKLEAKKANP